MLRGVPDPIQMFQLTTVPNRVFPPLKVGDKVEDSVVGDVLSAAGGTESTDESMGASLLPIKSTSWVRIQSQINAVFKTLLSVQPPGPRGKFLIDTCRRWQLDVPTSDNDKTAFVTSPDALDKLSAKIAPIMAKRKEFINSLELGYVSKVNNYNTLSSHSGGGVLQNDSFHSNATHRIQAVVGSIHDFNGAAEDRGGGGSESLSVELPCVSQSQTTLLATPIDPTDEAPRTQAGHKHVLDHNHHRSIPELTIKMMVSGGGEGSVDDSMYSDVEEAVPQSVVCMPEVPDFAQS